MTLTVLASFSSIKLSCFFSRPNLTHTEVVISREAMLCPSLLTIMTVFALLLAKVLKETSENFCFPPCSLKEPVLLFSFFKIM